MTKKMSMGTLGKYWCLLVINESLEFLQGKYIEVLIDRLILSSLMCVKEKHMMSCPNASFGIA